MKMMLSLAVVSLVLFAGCSFLNRIAPAQTDEQGNPIPGTHEVIQPVKDIAGGIPYGEAVVGILMLGWNLVERIRANKTSKGLMATVKAINQAAKDPATTEAIAKIKEYLSNAHDAADVKTIIKAFIAKA